MAMALETESATFQRELSTLLEDPANRGQFALVRGDNVAGVYPTFEAALSAGYDRFGLDPFLVKEITEHEEPRYFSRNLRCPS
jgi:hypothetical protein